MIAAGVPRQPPSYQLTALLRLRGEQKVNFRTHIRHVLKHAFKGSVSRILRWVLLNINRKLSLRPIIALNKILSLLKGHFIIYKRQAGAP